MNSVQWGTRAELVGYYLLLVGTWTMLCLTALMPLIVATTRDDNGSMAGFYRVPPTV